MHFVGNIASFLNSSYLCQTVLLPFSPMADETTQGAEEMSEFVNFTLVQYGKSLKNVESISADNCEANKRLSDICQVPLGGCHSHRLALGIPDVSAKTWRRTFRQKKYAETSQAKKFVETSRMIYAMYARSPSPSQRPAPTTIASRSPFPLGLCSCSTWLSKMGI